MLRIPYQLISPILSIMLMIAPAVLLAGDSTESDQDTHDYITPDEMTPEDIEMLQEYSDYYNQCLVETTQQQLAIQDDARQVANIAMKDCAVHLEKLYQEMTRKNFDPGFAQGYVRRVSNKGGNMALRAAMMGAIQKQSSQQADDQAADQPQEPAQ